MNVYILTDGKIVVERGDFHDCIKAFDILSAGLGEAAEIEEIYGASIQDLMKDYSFDGSIESLFLTKLNLTYNDLLNGNY